MTQNIRVIVQGVISPLITALRTAHTSTVSAVADLIAVLNTKANLVHTHTSNQITDLAKMTRNAHVTTLQPDGQTLVLPWVIGTNVAACDVMVNHAPLYVSEMTSTANTIILNTPQTPGLLAQIIYYSDTVISTGQQLAVDFTDNFVTFFSLAASHFTSSGGGVSDGNATFTSEPASIWLSGGTGLTGSDTILQSVGASEYL